ncbi:hypothetical protein [Nannocystis pusilla]|uniref:Uncharacterized protein n=1 Tax=Nannocystis pusilla TaxID=889268 RepID=A0ABS7TRZ2_9BACT|nr:hypothetical protein [Nannocystis pusilla]MBZ5710992.1 hypothetical protein [Nannocystis pusilla]
MTGTRTMDPDQLAAAVASALLERDAADPPIASPRPPTASPPFAAHPEAPAPFDEAATRRHVELLTTLLQALTLRARSLARDNAANIAAAQSSPTDTPERRLVDAAIRVHALLVEHPVATRALVSAFAAEGRRFAGTPAGEALRDRLLRSRLVRRGALLWNSLTMGLIDDTEPTALPSAYVDVLVELSEHIDLERLLGEMKAGGRP